MELGDMNRATLTRRIPPPLWELWWTETGQECMQSIGRRDKVFLKERPEHWQVLPLDIYQSRHRWNRVIWTLTWNRQGAVLPLCDNSGELKQDKSAEYKQKVRNTRTLAGISQQGTFTIVDRWNWVWELLWCETGQKTQGKKHPILTHGFFL